MMSRIIFLDIDGVLHDVDTPEIAVENGRMTVVGEHLFAYAEHLVKLLESHPDVDLVIHSSWRNHFSLDEMRAYFPEGLCDRVVATTQPGLGRAESIMAYIEDHSTKAFLILDDMPEEFCRHSAPPEELVVCHKHLGISSRHTQMLIREWLKTTS